MKALVGAFNQEKALVGAFSVIVQLHRLIDLRHYPGMSSSSLSPGQGPTPGPHTAPPAAAAPRPASPGPARATWTQTCQRCVTRFAYTCCFPVQWGQIFRLLVSKDP